MRKIYTAITILLFSASSFAGIGTDFISNSVQEQATPTVIEAFTIADQVGETAIDADAATVTIEMLVGTDVAALVPTFTLSEGASAYVGQVTTTTLQVSEETAQDFTSAVVYTIENDGATQDWTVTVNLVETIAENNLSQVSMYPNPVNNVLTIANMNGVKEVIVSNVLGQALFAKPVSGVEMTINTSEFRNGIYIITIVSENGLVRSERIIKE